MLYAFGAWPTLTMERVAWLIVAAFAGLSIFQLLPATSPIQAMFFALALIVGILLGAVLGVQAGIEVGGIIAAAKIAMGYIYAFPTALFAGALSGALLRTCVFGDAG